MVQTIGKTLPISESILRIVPSWLIYAICVEEEDPMVDVCCSKLIRAWYCYDVNFISEFCLSWIVVVEDCWKKNGYPSNFSSNKERGGQTFHGNGRGSNVDKSGKVCNYCGITGHNETECFKKHGYPPGHRLHKVPGANISNTTTKPTNNENSTTTTTTIQERQNSEMKLTS